MTPKTPIDDNTETFGLNSAMFTEILQADVEHFEHIVDFKVRRAVDVGENFMTNVVKVAIEVQLNDGERERKVQTYMVKTLSESSDMQKMNKSFRIFEKEKYAYEHLLPAFEQMYANVGKTVQFGPRIHEIDAKHLNDSTDILVMEDLNGNGYAMINRQIGLDMAQTKLVLRKLAEFHAASACFYQMHGAYPEMFDTSLTVEVDTFGPHRTLMTNCLRHNLDACGNASYLSDKLKRYCELAEDFYQIPAPYNPNEFRVLNHGDLWINNLLFQPADPNKQGDTEKVLFIDFQMARYASPVQDLFYFLLSSTVLENKLKYFDYFIHYYHTKLIENLKLLNYTLPMPTLKQLHIATYENSGWAYTACVYLLPVVLTDPSKEANIDNLLGESDSGVCFKMAMFQNKQYLENMKILLPWMDAKGFLDL